MEEKRTSPVTAFDSLFTTGKIQMLKVLAAWLPPSQQGMLVLYIKLLELEYAFSLLRRPEKLPIKSRYLSADFLSGDNSDALALLDELLPYGSPAERSRIEGMKSMLQNLGKIKEMMEMAEMMKEMFPEGFGGGEDPTDILSGLAALSGMDMSNMTPPQ